jgi:Tfp pilus assembly protein PilF/DNA-binding MarR family transcriptional regulator
MYIFNAKIETPDHLEELLIGRKGIVDSIEKSIQQALLHGQNVNHLLIGTRGSGKTHMMQVLYNRFSKDKIVAEKAEIAYMAEEEIGIDSFLSLLIRIFEAFIRWNRGENENEIIDWKTKIDILKNLKAHEREDQAKNYLLDFLKNKKLILLIENINDLFSSMKKTGQSRLRDFLQQYDKVNIIATSQVLFEDIQNEDRPFHNFFQITHLDRLTESETQELLITLAKTEGPEELKDHFSTNKGIGQVKSIHFLSGGNHRLINLFYEFLKTDLKSDMADPFLKTLDKLKPYYEYFLRSLPPQQQKIIHFLALKHKPQLGSVIAKECFLTQGGTSKQMNELQNKGFVEAHRIGRDSRYELSEPMLRFCIELTENRDGIIGMLARFLSILYSDTEIINRYLKLKYLTPFNCPDEKLKTRRCDETVIYEKAGEEFKNNIKHLETLIQSIENESARKALVKITMMTREKYISCPYVSDDCPCSYLMNKKENEDKVWKVFITQLIRYSLYDQAFSIVNQVLKRPINEKKENVTIPILFIRGLNRSSAGKDVIEKYSQRLLELPIDDFSRKLIKTYIDFELNKNSNAIYELSKEERSIFYQIIKTKTSYHYPPEMLDIRHEPNEKKELLYNNLINKYPTESYVLNDYAGFLASIKKYEEAEKFYLRAIELNPSEAEFTDDYGLFLVTKIKNIEKAKIYFKKSIELDKSKEYWFRYVDFLEDIEQNVEEANKIYLEMTSLFPSSSKVFLQYGVFKLDHNNINEALKNLNKAIKLNSNNPFTYYYRGKIFAIKGENKTALENFTTAINIEPKNLSFYLERGLFYLQINEIMKSHEDLKQIFKIGLKEIKAKLVGNSKNVSEFLLYLLFVSTINNDIKTFTKTNKIFKSTKLSKEIALSYDSIILISKIIQGKLDTYSNEILNLTKEISQLENFISYRPLSRYIENDTTIKTKNKNAIIRFLNNFNVA